MGGYKGLFDYVRYDKAKPGILSRLGPFMDDVVAGLIGGVSANMYTRAALSEGSCTLKDLLFALKSGFGWLSTIPVGISMEGIEALMRHVYVFPLVGLVLGAILGGVAYIAGQALPANLVAIVVIVAIYKLCGINHIDGLADFGDGVIAHGTREKKVAAMKDVSLGTGGGSFHGHDPAGRFRDCIRHTPALFCLWLCWWRRSPPKRP